MSGSGAADLIVYFGPAYSGVDPRGLWMLRGSTWISLHSAIVPIGAIGLADLDADGRDDLLGDFDGYGIWRFVDGGGWTFFAASSPRIFDAGSVRRFEARKVY